ncbi:AraC family transcriptional regulator [Suicoccus acidiformans]|uniref:AraC family transcriptional regulator n=1 Tax=Suicoccus acidiformans TaxID=2036206 RepID=UPI0013C30EBB|nr:AraC family transcriptional regulator [Suicoccus acidiformans]
MQNKIVRIFQNVSYVDLYPIQFGYEQCSAEHVVPLSKFNNYIFHFIKSGSGYVHIDSLGHEIKLSKGQGFMFEPGIISSYRSDYNDPWEYYWVEFNGIKSENYLNRIGLDHQNQVYTIKNMDEIDIIVYFYQQLLNAEETDDIYILSILYGLFHALFEYSDALPKCEENMTRNFYVKEAIKFISRNFTNSITIEDVANHCNINRTYLTKLFNEELNLTPSHFLIKTRLSRGCDLLTSTNKSIAEIADDIGYSNQFIFSTAFKKEYGIPPTEWRNQHQQ